MRVARLDRVHQEVDTVGKGALLAVGHAPLEEVAALELAQGLLVGVVALPVAGAGPIAQLRLPPRDGGVDDDVGLAQDGRPKAVHDDEPLRVPDLLPRSFDLVLVIELVDGVVGHDAEDAVVGDVVGDALLDAFRRLCVVIGEDGERRGEGVNEPRADLVDPGARIALDDEDDRSLRLVDFGERRLHDLDGRGIPAKRPLVGMDAYLRSQDVVPPHLEPSRGQLLPALHGTI